MKNRNNFTYSFTSPLLLLFNSFGLSDGSLFTNHITTILFTLLIISVLICCCFTNTILYFLVLYKYINIDNYKNVRIRKILRHIQNKSIFSTYVDIFLYYFSFKTKLV